MRSPFASPHQDTNKHTSTCGHFRTSELTSAAHVVSLPLRPSSCPGCSGSESLCGESLDKATEQLTWFRPEPSFSYSGEALNRSAAGADGGEEIWSLRPHSLCPRFAAAVFLFPLTATTVVCRGFTPQLQNVSCCSGVTHFHDRCPPPQAIHSGA
jgi:hypothetical protein